MSAFSGFVYFVTPEDGGLVKIGYSKNPVSRIKGLMAWSPVPLVCLATYAADPRDEAVVHDAFRADRVRGEWFRRSDDLMNLIQLVKDGGHGPMVEWDGVFPGNTLSAVKDYRERHGWSAEEFAEICDADLDEVERWEFGPTQVCAIARILRVLPMKGYAVTIHDLYRNRYAA